MISTRAVNLLRRIADSEDGEFVYSSPGGWWVDDHQASARDAFELLRYCLIHKDYGDEKYEVYSINEDGRGLLAAPNYTPRIITVLRKLNSEKEK
jgi:hypothetical protein